MPQLDKVMEFERTAMQVIFDDEPRVVKFAADPFPMLRALAEGRLPEGVPQVGDYEIELKPEGPVTVMVLVHESMRKPVQFDDEGYRGTIVPVPGHGSIAVLMRDLKAGGGDKAGSGEIERIAAHVDDSIVWTK